MRLGIGATTAIFTLVHAVLLRSLPVAKPSELYRVGDVEDCCVNGGLQDNWSIFSHEKYKAFRDGTQRFTEPATVLAGFAMKSQLFGVKAYAPDILLVTTFVLGMAALLATMLPARKAASLEPIRALRTE